MRFHEKLKYRLRQKGYRKKCFKNINMNFSDYFKDITEVLENEGQGQKFKNNRRRR